MNSRFPVGSYVKCEWMSWYMREKQHMDDVRSALRGKCAWDQMVYYQPTGRIFRVDAYLDTFSTSFDPEPTDYYLMTCVAIAPDAPNWNDSVPLGRTQVVAHWGLAAHNFTPGHASAPPASIPTFPPPPVVNYPISSKYADVRLKVNAQFKVGDIVRICESFNELPVGVTPGEIGTVVEVPGTFSNLYYGVMLSHTGVIDYFYDTSLQILTA
jgi:hypothetical protein